MQHKGKLVKLALAALAACTVLTAAPVLAQAKVGGNVVISMDTEPDALDPQKSATAAVNLVMRYLGDTLVAKDLKGNLIPGLASKWTSSNDRLNWTFTLRPGIKFHDGAPVDAAAVKASFDRALDPETKSAVAAALLEPVASISTPSATTIRFTLKRPYALLIENLTQQATSIVSAKAAKSAGANFGRSPVLTGPWMFSRWDTGSRIILKRNPAYAWGPSYAHAGAPYIETLTFQIVPDAATALSAFTANNTNILTALPKDVETLKAAGKYQIYTFQRKGLGLFMAFNVTKAPFDNQLVRKAMQSIINKQPLVQIALKGLGQTACGPLPPSIWGYWEGICDYAPKFDLERGKKLLQQAGYKPDANGVFAKGGKQLRFTLYTNPTAEWVQSAQILQAQFRNAGILMDIETFEHNTLLTKDRAGDHQATLMAYTYTSADILNSYLNSERIKVGYNWSHYKDEAIDRMLSSSRQLASLTARANLYRDIQKSFTDKALWVPLWINDNYLVVQPQVKDARLSTEGYLSLLDAYVE